MPLVAAEETREAGLGAVLADAKRPAQEHRVRKDVYVYIYYIRIRFIYTYYGYEGRVRKGVGYGSLGLGFSWYGLAVR
jgi:hypothetical protein